MAGSHRAPQPRSTTVSGRVRVLIVLLVVAVAVVAGFALVGGGDDSPGRKPTGTPSSTPTTTPTVTPTPTATPTPTPTKSSSASALPRLAEAPPRRLVIAGLLDVGFDDSIEPAGDRFPTRSTAELSRWGSRGLPGSPGSDTVFIAGRIAADGDSGFGPLPMLAVGRRIDIGTDDGTLTYSVRAVQSRSANGLASAPVITARVPGRLVLVGIRYGADDSATSDYVIVTAELTGVRPD